jgi:hypothetical protein
MLDLLFVLIIGLQAQLGTPLIAGDANFADPSHGGGYLAMRLDHGTVVRICGNGGCKEMVVTDYGPVEATGDIADIALVRFASVCGYTIEEARIRGECEVEVEILDAITLPPTDTVEEGDTTR